MSAEMLQLQEDLLAVDLQDSQPPTPSAFDIRDRQRARSCLYITAIS